MYYIINVLYSKVNKIINYIISFTRFPFTQLSLTYYPQRNTSHFPKWNPVFTVRKWFQYFIYNVNSYLSIVILFFRPKSLICRSG